MSERRAVTATVCGSPYDTEKLSTSKSGTVRPTTDTGTSGDRAERAVARAKGRFFWNSACTRPSSSGNVKTLAQSSAAHSSAGSWSLTVSQVDISGVKARTP